MSIFNEYIEEHTKANQRAVIVQFFHFSFKLLVAKDAKDEEIKAQAWTYIKENLIQVVADNKEDLK